jgi:peptidoglycan/xylan/chitin deacetylase (PgdA/CDA1 family)
MYRTLFSSLSPPGPGARLSVLLFHRVLPAPDPLFPGIPDAARFDSVCGWLARWFNVLPLDTAVKRLRAGTLPARAAAITFDDGYADNHDVAMPILKRHGLSATFFIATGFLDGGRMWNDTVIECVRRVHRPSLDLSCLGFEGIGELDIDDWAKKRAALGRLLRAIKYLSPQERDEAVMKIAASSGVSLPHGTMMRSEQVQALRDGGMQVGAHTLTHPILAGLSRDQARAEILGSKQVLEQLLSDPVCSFAYPNGKPDVDYTAESVQLAREAGFELAVSTAWGAASQTVDAMQVPRFTPWDRSRWRYAARLAKNLRVNARRATDSSAMDDADSLN